MKNLNEYHKKTHRGEKPISNPYKYVESSTIEKVLLTLLLVFGIVCVLFGLYILISLILDKCF